MCRSVNAAAIAAFASGVVNSGSVMVTCPSFSEVAAYARNHPELDIGIHLTLTCVRGEYAYDPILPRKRVPSLLDRDGYMYESAEMAAARLAPREAELEICAQIEAARAFGIEPTHLDSHMGTLYQNKALCETLLRVARHYKLPVLISAEWLAVAKFLPSVLKPSDIIINRAIMVGLGRVPPPALWGTFYTGALKSIRPGVTQIIIHPAYETAEMRAATMNCEDFGAAWRQRDFDFFTGEAACRALKENKLRLITWREIGKLLSDTHRHTFQYRANYLNRIPSS